MRTSHRGLLRIVSVAGALFFGTLCTAWADSGSGWLLVLEKTDRSLAIVDPGSLKVVARVPAGPDPHEVIASPDGKHAYISNYGGGSPNPYKTISVVDLVGRKALPPVDLGALRAPHGLAFEGGEVYFTAEGNKVIGRLDPATNQVDWVLGLGQNRTHMIVVTHDGGRMITSNVNGNTISVIDKVAGPDGWSIANVSVGKGPEGFDLAPDGNEIWAANSHDGTVSVIDARTKAVAATLNIPTQSANRLKFTPDGKFVLIGDAGTGDLVIVDASSRKEAKRIRLGRGAEGILMQPDGSRAFVAVSPDDNVAVIDLKTLEVTGRIATGKNPDGMAWAQRQ